RSSHTMAKLIASPRRCRVAGRRGMVVFPSDGSRSAHKTVVTSFLWALRESHTPVERLQFGHTLRLRRGNLLGGRTGNTAQKRGFHLPHLRRLQAEGFQSVVYVLPKVALREDFLGALFGDAAEVGDDRLPGLAVASFGLDQYRGQ